METLHDLAPVVNEICPLGTVLTAPLELCPSRLHLEEVLDAWLRRPLDDIGKTPYRHLTVLAFCRPRANIRTLSEAERAYYRTTQYALEFEGGSTVPQDPPPGPLGFVSFKARSTLDNTVWYLHRLYPKTGTPLRAETWQGDTTRVIDAIFPIERFNKGLDDRHRASSFQLLDRVLAEHQRQSRQRANAQRLRDPVVHLSARTAANAVRQLPGLGEGIIRIIAFYEAAIDATDQSCTRLVPDLMDVSFDDVRNLNQFLATWGWDKASSPFCSLRRYFVALEEYASLRACCDFPWALTPPGLQDRLKTMMATMTARDDCILPALVHKKRKVSESVDVAAVERIIRALESLL